MLSLTRRHFLQTAAALPAVSAFSLSAARAEAPPRVLVLVELNGGNDGLNTVVPYADPGYAAQRPTLAVPRAAVLQLDERLGLNPALEPLMPAWRDGDLAVALNVGYPRPNRSHFRAIEIWNSASSAEETLPDGWLHRVVVETGAAAAPPAGFARQGIVLGGPEGPLAGAALAPVVMRDPRQLAEVTRLLGSGATTATNPALAYILATRARTQGAADEISRRLKNAAPLTTVFPKSALGHQLEIAAGLIAAGVPASVMKLQHSGYDTHAQQGNRHRALLAELADGLAAFRQALRGTDAWRRVLVMTYAEFGRRVAENASGGTDHGTAAPHFLLGGGLRGGLYGAPPRLDDLDGGDLRPALDFRQIYATVAGDWLGLPPAPASLGRHARLPLIA